MLGLYSSGQWMVLAEPDVQHGEDGEQFAGGQREVVQARQADHETPPPTSSSKI